MSNIQNELCPTSRAMLVGAMLGGAASVASKWKQRQQGELSANEFVGTVAKDTLKAGAVSGVTTFAAGKMAGQPLLSMFTIVAVGAAGLCLLEQNKEKLNHE